MASTSSQQVQEVEFESAGRDATSMSRTKGGASVTPEQGGSAESNGDVPKGYRVVRMHDAAWNRERGITEKWSENKVSTAQYNVLTFLPKHTFNFFRVVANFYFLLISILQVSTTLSPTNPYSTITPLIVIFILSAAKEGWEDYGRHLADRETNARPARRAREEEEEDARHEYEVLRWQDVCVGDLLVVKDREEVPADIVVLATSEEEGRCFIETANLDGETNLKRREAVGACTKLVGSRSAEEDVPTPDDVLGRVKSKLAGQTVYEPPSKHLYTFSGRLDLKQQDGSMQQFPINPENVILRGCQLRSCSFVVGMALYTGKDTRLMKNQRDPPTKQSNVYRQVNRYIFLIFAVQFLLCVGSAIAFGQWQAATLRGDAWYLGDALDGGSGGTLDAVVSFVTFLILYNNLVPISLYVSLDLIKVTQARIMEADPEMAYTLPREDDGAPAASLDPSLGDGGGAGDEDGTNLRSSTAYGTGTAPLPSVRYAKARTSSLNEDLGQIEFIFSDKTGTLTQNVMEFRKCSVGGIAYGFGTTEIGRAALLRAQTSGGDASKVLGEGIPGIVPPSVAMKLSDRDQAQVKVDPKIAFDDPRFLQHLAGRLSADEANGRTPSSLDDLAPLSPEEIFPFPPSPSSSGAGDHAQRQATALRDFLTLLSVCHTVIPERDSRTGKVAYRASSPDEEALVKAAKCLGFDLVGPAPRIQVRIGTGGDGGGGGGGGEGAGGGADAVSTFHVVGVNEFNSTRKRMSVVVRDPETGNGMVYIKGADNVMFDLIDNWGESLPMADSAGMSPESVLHEHLKVFAGEGLRTLVLAQRSMTPTEVDEWEQKYNAAAAALEDRKGKLSEVADLAEQGCTLVGATAIEDKLQDGVPEAIATLARAGIKIWVLTGDKEETAINIGFACRLLDDGMMMIKINGKSNEEGLEEEGGEGVGKGKDGGGAAYGGDKSDEKVSDEELEHRIAKQLRSLCMNSIFPFHKHVPEELFESNGKEGMISGGASIVSVSETATHVPARDSTTVADGSGAASSPRVPGKDRFALVIDGKALALIFKKGSDGKPSPLVALLLAVARECRAVVACRVSPSQKADIVSMVRKGVSPQPMTLAIGDGANDVNMIQTAHVGIGISGNEGVQAVNSSDYAIAQFRFLVRLLLVHGRLNYQRISKTILYSFYKNVALVSVLFFYQFYTGFSGTTLFESFVQAGWNFFTALPIISVGIEDHDIPDTQAARFPKLYEDGMRNSSLNPGLFALWLVNGVYHAVVVFFMHLPLLLQQPWSQEGSSDGIFIAGFTVYASLLLTAQYKVMLLARAWTRGFVLTLLISLFLYILFSVVYSFLALQINAPFAFVPFLAFSRPNFWFSALLVPVAALIVDVAAQATVWLMDGPCNTDILRLILYGPLQLPACLNFLGPVAPPRRELLDAIPKDLTMPGDNLSDLRRSSRMSLTTLARLTRFMTPAMQRGGHASRLHQTKLRALGMAATSSHTGFDFSFTDGDEDRHRNNNVDDSLPSDGLVTESLE